MSPEYQVTMTEEFYQAHKHKGESMSKYVPTDWPGPVTTCRTCGNDAPDVPRVVGGKIGGEGPRECSNCFIGRVLNEACSEQEARALRAELTSEIKQPSTPWNKEG